MQLQLGEEDRRAVDLLLDQGLTAEAMGSARAGYAAPSADPARLRLRSVSDLLGMLSLLPAAEPPPDLVARTLRFVEGAAGTTPRGSYLGDVTSAVDRPLA